MSPAERPIAAKAIERWHGHFAADRMVRSEKFTGVNKAFGNPLASRRDQKSGSSVLRELSNHNFQLLRMQLACTPALHKKEEESETQAEDTTAETGATAKTLARTPALHKKEACETQAEETTAETGATAKTCEAQRVAATSESTPLENRLSVLEREFIQAVIAAPWFLTHATPASLMPEGSDTLRLLSRERVLHTSMDQAQLRRPHNLAMNQADLLKFKNGNYVFFALEAGAQPKKNSSRFGSTMYRIPLNTAQLGDRSIMSLGDLMFSAGVSSLMREYAGVMDPGELLNLSFDHRSRWHGSGLQEQKSEALWSVEAKTQAPTHEIGNQEGIPDRFLFDAGVSLEAVALSVVVSARMIGDNNLSQALLAADHDSINRAVNSLFRPQVMVPNELVTNQAEEMRITENY